MKVLMFGWEFPPNLSGGLGTACYGIVKGLLKSGTDVLFVVPKKMGGEDEDVSLINASDIAVKFSTEEYKDFWKKLTYLEVSSLLRPYVSPEEFYRLTDKTEHDYTDVKHSVFAEKYEFSGKYGKDLVKEVARYAVVGAQIALQNDFDIIHAHDWLTFSAGIAAKELTGKPLVVHVHATEKDRSGEHVNQHVFDIEKKGMEAADCVIAVSHFTRKIIIDKYGINPDKVVVVHNAVAEPDYEFQADVPQPFKEKIVTFLGRITFQKGPDYFVEAAHKVHQYDKNIRFVMAGSGDMMNKMVKRVAQLRMSSHFHFTGFLKDQQVDRMFAMSDVYVMPSVSEPFGISPLEAMRSNVPVIISKQSGVSEVLVHAIKVDFWDVDSMANAIYGLANYDAINKMFSHHGKAEVEKLKWDNVGVKLTNLYKEVLSK